MEQRLERTDNTIITELQSLYASLADHGRFWPHRQLTSVDGTRQQLGLHCRWKNAAKGAERLNTTSVANSICAMPWRSPGASAARSVGLEIGTNRRTQ
jgi:hypothetical protein